MVQRGAMWCNVVQRGGACCSELQCAAVWCNVVQRGGACCSELQCAAVCSGGGAEEYRVATVSRIDKIIGLFCKRDL